MNPWDIPAPSADNPGAKIVSLHRGYVRPLPKRDLYLIFDADQPIEDDRPNLYQSLREQEERGDRLPSSRSLIDEPAWREAMFLLAGAVSALLWLGAFFLAGWLGWL